MQGIVTVLLTVLASLPAGAGLAILIWSGSWMGWGALIVGLCISAFFVYRPYQVDEGTVQVVTSFGKYVRTDQRGLNFLHPCQECGITLPISVQTETFAKQRGVCTDGVEVDLDMVIRFKLEDTYRAIFGVKDWKRDMDKIAESILQDVISEKKVQDLIVSRHKICQEIQIQLNSQLTTLGFSVIWVGFSRVDIPEKVKEANEESWAAETVDKTYTQIAEFIAGVIKRPDLTYELFQKLKALRVLQDMAKGNATKVLLSSEITDLLSKLYSGQINTSGPGIGNGSG